MGFESLPLALFLLLPGFLCWFIFSWGTVSFRVGQFHQLFISLLLSIISLTIAYLLTVLAKFGTLNIFNPSWDTTRFPAYGQVLSDPTRLPLELGAYTYATAVVLGFILIGLYRSERISVLFSGVGLDFRKFESVWRRLFHISDYVTVYLKDGRIVAGWPTYFSEIGSKEEAELYLTKMHYYDGTAKRWVKPDKSVTGLLLNINEISSIEFRDLKGESKRVMNARWLQWIEFAARFIVWCCGIGFAILTVIGTIPILPEDTAIGLIILLYVFMVAAVIAWVFDMRRYYPPRKK